MGSFTLTIKTGNAAFGDTTEERNRELAIILSALSVKVELGHHLDGIPCHDTNGNNVGTTTYQEET